jgi:hypothetical protein
MTITDQGCTKVVILLPCSEESGSKDIASVKVRQDLVLDVSKSGSAKA